MELLALTYLRLKEEMYALPSYLPSMMCSRAERRERLPEKILWNLVSTFCKVVQH
jgi:hypothetical protein